MNKQEIFTKVANHLLAQGKPAKEIEGSRCYFRQGDLKCAVGALIPDEEYFLEMEELGAIRNIFYAVHYPGASDSKTREYISQIGPVFKAIISDKENEDLLASLQFIHDSSDPANWKTQLTRVAEEYNLQMV